MKEQLLVLVEWAKYIPAFCELPLDDQVRADVDCGQGGALGRRDLLAHLGYSLGLV